MPKLSREESLRYLAQADAYIDQLVLQVEAGKLGSDARSIERAMRAMYLRGVQDALADGAKYAREVELEEKLRQFREVFKKATRDG